MYDSQRSLSNIQLYCGLSHRLDD